MATDALRQQPQLGGGRRGPERPRARAQRTRSRSSRISTTSSSSACTRAIMSPLVWDLGHIAAYEDLWLAHRLGERSLLRPELARCMTPSRRRARCVATSRRSARPTRATTWTSFARARLETLAERGVGDGVICEMVIRHELQHGETMRQTLAIAGLLNDADAAASDEPLQPRSRARMARGRRPARSRWAPATEGFSYDNERPRHRVETAAFEIARRPLSNAELLRFAEQGGYERRECGRRRAGRGCRSSRDPQHRSIAEGHPDATACHLSWFEAEAYAKAHDARLPSEAEWEKAATLHAEELEGLGRAWEWTRSALRRLPGLRRVSVPRVLGGLLRRGLPRAQRRLVGDRRARRERALPQLGPATAPPDLRGRAPVATEPLSASTMCDSVRLLGNC